MRASENSTAIDRGPGPRSKSDEFSEVRMACDSVFTIVRLKPPRICCTFWDLESKAAPSRPRTLEPTAPFEPACDQTPLRHTMRQRPDSSPSLMSRRSLGVNSMAQPGQYSRRLGGARRSASGPGRDNLYCIVLYCCDHAATPTQR